VYKINSYNINIIKNIDGAYGIVDFGFVTGNRNAVIAGGRDGVLRVWDMR
jgi:hypothetical protein